MTVEQAILENVKVLSPDQQQEVLAFIKLLQSDKWEHIYKGRFKELQQKIRLGMDAADRSEVINAEDMFRSLRLKLQQRRTQADR
jgi:antitoxin ParD1/3/4